MEWENQPALDALLAEAENLGDGYLSVARVLPERRKEQVGSWRVGPVPELESWLDEVAREVPDGTRLRVRLYRPGGKVVRGVVVHTPTPCPNCAELLADVEDQNHRFERASDERDDAHEKIRELAATLKTARRDLKETKRQLRIALRLASEWRERAEQGEALAAMVNAMELS